MQAGSPSARLPSFPPLVSKPLPPVIAGDAAGRYGCPGRLALFRGLPADWAAPAGLDAGLCVRILVSAGMLVVSSTLPCRAGCSAAAGHMQFNSALLLVCSAALEPASAVDGRPSQATLAGQPLQAFPLLNPSLRPRSPPPPQCDGLGGPAAHPHRPAV